MANQSWTDSRVEQLKTLWTEGYSASEVARIMGGGVTRSAVCGKVDRLGLPNRLPTKHGGMRVAKPRVYAVRTQEPVTPADEPESLRINLADIGSKQCRWIANDPLVDASMCGRPANGTLCPFHKGRAFVPIKQKP